MDSNDANTAEHRQRLKTADFPEEREWVFEAMLETVFEPPFGTVFKNLRQCMSCTVMYIHFLWYRQILVMSPDFLGQAGALLAWLLYGEIGP